MLTDVVVAGLLARRLGKNANYGAISVRLNQLSSHGHCHEHGDRARHLVMIVLGMEEKSATEVNQSRRLFPPRLSLIHR